MYRAHIKQVAAFTIVIGFMLCGCQAPQKEASESKPVTAQPPPPPPPAAAVPAPAPAPAQPAAKSTPFFTAKFDNSAEGWTLAPWKLNPDYENGVILVSTASGHPAGCVECKGTGESNNIDSCTREGGELSKIISTAGYKSIKIEYDLFFDTNKTGPDCSGKCQVVENDCADKLAVYSSTTGLEGPWNLLEQVASADVAQSEWLHRSIDISGMSSAANNVNFALRFKFQFNNTIDIGRLDNIQLTGMK